MRALGQRCTVSNEATCKCGARWTGTRMCHCGNCHRTFAGLELFDRHRAQTGVRGVCRDPETMRDRAGYRIAFWRDGMWRSPEMTTEAKTALYGGLS